jgi:hypothetical protein
VESIEHRPVTRTKIQTPTAKCADDAVVAFAAFFMIVAKSAGAFSSIMSVSMSVSTKSAREKMLVLILEIALRIGVIPRPWGQSLL